MGKPAARISDMHVCPMATPGVPPIPHVGGPITGPGCPTVLIGGMPAAVMGDMCVCTGPPDTIVLGSAGVLIGGKPAARMGDQCAHGGTIVVGCPTVLIGEVSPAPAGGGGAAAGMAGALAGGIGGIGGGIKVKAVADAFEQNAASMTAPQATKLSRMQALLQGAEDGSPTVHMHDEQECKVQYQVLAANNEPVKGQAYKISTNDGNTFSGKTDNKGMTQQVSGYSEGDCTLSFEE
jgi:uncharacterized Zn-binding protein involved in type VI secretion